MTGNSASLQDGLQAVYDRFRLWMRDAALPLWASVGCDPAGLGFVEQLTLSGTRDDVAYKRVRVQARQIYVFSHAHLLGWRGGLAAATRGHEFLTAHGARGDGGWVRRLGAGGGVVDATADLYDIAFVLFSLAWFGRASGHDAPIVQAHLTLDWLEAKMASRYGGFLDTLPIEAETRKQNPHMHLLEAALALYETSGEERFLGFARRLVGLFRDRFFAADSGALGEFFEEDWSVAPGAAGDHLEPGHHYEWAWLLGRHSAATGEDFSDQARALYAFANTHGIDHNSDLIVDIVDRRGRVQDASMRLWPQTEAIKAHVAMGDRAVAPLVEALFTRFLDPAPSGAWHDHFSADGRLKSKVVPASSFYHLFMAFGELARVAAPDPATALS